MDKNKFRVILIDEAKLENVQIVENLILTADERTSTPNSVFQFETDTILEKDNIDNSTSTNLKVRS